MAMVTDGGAVTANSRTLELRTVQAPIFKVLVEALKELLTDTCIEFDETGMKIVAMDTGHVVLVHLKLDANEFEYYHCPSYLRVGINMLNLHKIIKTINSNDTLTLYVDSDDVNHMCIKIENVDKNSCTVYKLILLELSHDKISVDGTEFTKVVTLPCVDFQKICRDMHNLAEFMEIKCIHNQLIFSCVGDFCSQETVIRDNEADASFSTTGGPNNGAVADNAGGGGAAGSQSQIVQGVFSLKHLVLFTKCTNLCSTVELYLKNDYPLIIKYQVSSLGSIRMALAPKPDDERN